MLRSMIEPTAKIVFWSSYLAMIWLLAIKPLLTYLVTLTIFPIN